MLRGKPRCKITAQTMGQTKIGSGMASARQPPTSARITMVTFCVVVVSFRRAKIASRVASSQILSEISSFAGISPNDGSAHVRAVPTPTLLAKNNQPLRRLSGANRSTCSPVLDGHACCKNKAAKEVPNAPSSTRAAIASWHLRWLSATNTEIEASSHVPDQSRSAERSTLAWRATPTSAAATVVK